MDGVRYQIFVSSTFEDLRPERQQVIQAILELGHIPVGMELFPASDDSSWQIIERAIAESDYYVVVVGGRYGTTNDVGLGFTEREYDFAVASGVPALGFVREDIDSLPANLTERESAGRDRLAAFVRKVKARACRPWKNGDDLGLQVLKSLNNEIRIRPRKGWVRADQAKSVEDFQLVEELRGQIATLEADLGERQKALDVLERHIRDNFLPGDDIAPELLATGDDLYEILVFFGQGKDAGSRRVSLSWNDMFRAIAPHMYGYIQRRDRHDRKFLFEDDIVDAVREKIIEDVGMRKLTISKGQVDSILFQLKQRGLLQFEENDKGFRGLTLTPKGEIELTRLLVVKRPE